MRRTPATTVRDWGKEANAPLRVVRGGVHILSHSLTVSLPARKRRQGATG